LFDEENESDLDINTILEDLEKNDWYSDIVYYLKNLTYFDHLVNHQWRYLRLKATKYYIVQCSIYWKDLDGLLMRCVDNQEAKFLMINFHKGLFGGDQAT